MSADADTVLCCNCGGDCFFAGTQSGLALWTCSECGAMLSTGVPINRKQKMTYKAIGKLFGISLQAVQQTEKKALKKFERAFKETYGEDVEAEDLLPLCVGAYRTNHDPLAAETDTGLVGNSTAA